MLRIQSILAGSGWVGSGVTLSFTLPLGTIIDLPVLKFEIRGVAAAAAAAAAAAEGRQDRDQMKMTRIGSRRRRRKELILLRRNSELVSGCRHKYWACRRGLLQ